MVVTTGARDVTELVWLGAGAAPVHQSQAGLAAPRPPIGCRGPVQVESRAVINLVTMEPAQSLWPGRQSLVSLQEKSPGMSRSLELWQACYMQKCR